jgi:phage shock protein PspC (stress-responsive transcriptional regulator)
MTGPKFEHQPIISHAKGNNKMSKLTLDRTNKKIWGVCGGLANWTGIDATIVRIIFVLATLFGFGSALLVYVALGLILD